MSKLGFSVCLGAVALGSITGGCASSPAGPPPRSIEAISEDYRVQLEALHAKAYREIVWVDCSASARPPEGQCGMLTSIYLRRADLAAFQKEQCEDAPEAALSEACALKFTSFFIAKLRDRYFRADDVATERECVSRGLRCDSQFRDLELAMLVAHSKETFAKLENESSRLLAQMRADLVDRQQQVEALGRARERDDERRRAIFAGIANGLQSVSSGMTSSPGPAPTVTPASTSPRTSPSPIAVRPPPTVVSAGCASDFDCGIGKACVKGELQMRGVCAVTVDRNGVRVIDAPRPNLGPGDKGECSFDTQCPVGFRCEKGGGLTGTCVRPR